MYRLPPYLQIWLACLSAHRHINNLQFNHCLGETILPTWWELLPQNDNSNIITHIFASKTPKTTSKYKGGTMSSAHFFQRKNYNLSEAPTIVVWYRHIPNHKSISKSKVVLWESLTFLFKVKLHLFQTLALTNNSPIIKTLWLTPKSKSGVPMAAPSFSSKVKITTCLKLWS